MLTHQTAGQEQDEAMEQPKNIDHRPPIGNSIRNDGVTERTHCDGCMPNLTQPPGGRGLGPLPDSHFGSIPTTTSRLCSSNATSRRLKGHTQSICFQLSFFVALPVAYLRVHLIPAICKSGPNKPLAFKRPKIDQSRNLNIPRPLGSCAMLDSTSGADRFKFLFIRRLQRPSHEIIFFFGFIGSKGKKVREKEKNERRDDDTWPITQLENGLQQLGRLLQRDQSSATRHCTSACYFLFLFCVSCRTGFRSMMTVSKPLSLPNQTSY
jgi:hypothetical protein